MENEPKRSPVNAQLLSFIEFDPALEEFKNPMGEGYKWIKTLIDKFGLDPEIFKKRINVYIIKNKDDTYLIKTGPPIIYDKE
jgi:hypothetical protein